MPEGALSLVAKLLGIWVLLEFSIKHFVFTTGSSKVGNHGVARADPEPRSCCCVSRDHLELLGEASAADSWGAHQRTGTRSCCMDPHPGQRHVPAQTAEPWSQVPAPSSPQPRTHEPNAPERRCPRQPPSGPAHSGHLQIQSQQAEAGKEGRGLTICGQKEYTLWPLHYRKSVRVCSVTHLGRANGS
ncbi:unnamed protein product [Gulo gulo]|uniref:Uncharacterized protein n=1 Tax=Gulo gulo TaxID=48420 RepID=A0A9X9M7Y0_GULGU|nr:unnamed protein product [Gulo gulo]